jgi:hypothetical protein
MLEKSRYVQGVEPLRLHLVSQAKLLATPSPIHPRRAGEDRTVLIDRTNWPLHRRWVLLSLLVLTASTGWFLSESVGAADWPAGSSLPGLTFGILGGFIIVFEFLLWLRKKVRVRRIGPAQAWLRAHIWFGLLCLPLLVYHSGLRLGGTLSTVLIVLLVVVVVSGIWGLVLQQFLPQRLLDDVPAETIYSQIDRLSVRLAAEAEHLVRATCGPAPGEEVESLAAPEVAGASAASHLIVGAVQSVGLVPGKVLEKRHAELLRRFFHNTIAPFLRQGAASGSALRSSTRAAAMFLDLKEKLPAPAHGSVAILERFCQQRRQWAEQARIHFWLHNWLWVHFPLSVALIVLMVMHIVVALKYI